MTSELSSNQSDRTGLSETGRPPPTTYTVDVSDRAEDPDWDAFLAATPHGDHVQTSIWGQVKSCLGWHASRVVVRDGARIVGGAQLLVRESRFKGRIAYVPKGPVFARDEPDLVNLTTDTLCRIAAQESIRILFVQPARDSRQLMPRLADLGFLPAPIETAPAATVLVDLSSPLDAILARMAKDKRVGIRQSQRRGITVREGSLDDMSTFYQLLIDTSKRRAFPAFAPDYFMYMWRTLDPHGQIKMFLGEYEGEPVCAQLVAPFGDVVVAKQIGWSGQYGKRRPIEALDWETIRWAKSHGYAWYDLGGIELEAGRAVLAGDPLPRSLTKTPTAYKLRLGGKVDLSPEALCYLANPVLRAAYKYAGYKIANSTLVQAAADRFRAG